VGGTSIKMLKMVELINRKFERKLSLVTAFRFPQISSLFEYLNSIAEIYSDEDDSEITKSVNIMEGTFDLLNQDIDEK
jgi:surfactin family lipopeptide synthetase A